MKNKKSFEAEEIKSDIARKPFKYYRGRDTMIAQEHLKRMNYEQQGQLVVWDRIIEN